MLARKRLVCFGVMLPLMVGCGALAIERTLFPNQVVNGDGEPVFFDDLFDITTDTTLIPDQMAQQLANLGLQNQEIIDVIVEDGLSGVPPAPPPDVPTDDGTDDGTDGDGA